MDVFAPLRTPLEVLRLVIESQSPAVIVSGSSANRQGSGTSVRFAYDCAKLTCNCSISARRSSRK